MHGQHSVQGYQGEGERRHELQPICGSVYELSSPTSFAKDGRKIRVGDCALFQAGSAPPFIGILRRVSKQKEGPLQVTVNWLYRPADVKLAKGVAVEAAPNEIFYSFHKDEIYAASLLHPCKVAFLHKGVELPAGVSSFICRRVYDTNSKCLWWLTDQDYTDEHQEEVNLLLEKTKLEMHAAVQSGSPPPRPLVGNVPSQQQVKSSTEHGQNSGLQAGKGKKRERPDEFNKRERSSKSEDADSNPLKRQRTMRSEDLASITDKDGGLLDLAGVDKIVMLMEHDQTDVARKTTDCSSRRILLASIIAATEKHECLKRFVDLGGLPMLDEWLQEAHKGKVGEEDTIEGEKVFEDLLLVLLRALEKLPVDLDALKTCVIGKSVNNLRGHKNMDIQRKSRKLVDTWKKRVDAEMKSGEMKPSGSQGLPWHGKQATDCAPPHMGKGNGASEVVMKSSVGIGAGKMPGSLILHPALAKENQTKLSCNSASPELSAKEDRGSPSQSQGNGAAWPSGPSKVGNATLKEDIKSPVSVSNLKVSGAMSRSVGSHGNKGLGGQREVGLNKQMLGNKTTEKTCNSGLAVDTENTSTERSMVRISNSRRSPGRSGGSVVEIQGPGTSLSPTSNLETSSDCKNGNVGISCSEDNAGFSDSGAIVNEQQNDGKADDLRHALNSEVTEVKSPLMEEKIGSMTAGVGDGGMSLLASVAATEDLRCDTSHGTGSARSNLREDCTGEERIVASCPSKHDGGDIGSCLEGMPQLLVKQPHCSSPDDGKEEKENSVIPVPVFSEEMKNTSHEVVTKEASGEIVLPEEKNGDGDIDNSKIEFLSKFKKYDALDVSEGAKEVEQEVKAYGKPDIKGISESVGGDANSEADRNEIVCSTENEEGTLTAKNTSLQDGECKRDMSPKQEPDASNSIWLGNADALAGDKQVDEDKCSLSILRNEAVLSAPSMNVSCLDNASESVCLTAQMDTTQKSSDVLQPDAIANQLTGRPLFDFNKSISGDDSLDASSLVPLGISVCTAASIVVPSTCALTAPIAVVASTNGIIPPTSPLRINKDLGWKGSAATSAFRPAEPRRTPEQALADTSVAEVMNTRVKAPLDIDLNVVDEGICDDTLPFSVQYNPLSVAYPNTTSPLNVTSSGLSCRLDLDLNRVEESEEQSASLRSDSKLSENVCFTQSFKLSGANSQVLRDFDLNDGPLLEDPVHEESFFKHSNPNRTVGSGSSLNSFAHSSHMSAEGVSMTPWFPPISAVVPPSTKGDPSPPFPVTGVTATRSFLNMGVGNMTSVSGDPYKPAASSSVNVTYQTPSSAFPYPGFAFGSGFPFNSSFVGNSPSFVSSMSTPYSAVSSVNPGVVPGSLVRPPFLMSMADGVGAENNCAWTRRNLDLNAGPEPADNDAKDEINTSKQSFVLNGQYGLEDQTRAFRHVGATVGALKRKEPDNGWDLYRNAYKPSSWR